MQILIDSGGSKSDWMLRKNDRWMPVIRLDGYNPWQHPNERLLEIIQNLLKTNPEAKHASQIIYYGAGCADEAKKEAIYSTFISFFSQAKISVYSDLMAAAHALFGDKAGIACILGTGSSSGLYDGKQIMATTPSLGYLLGDEGSGAYLGKTIAQNYFKNLMPKDLRQKFADDYPLSLSAFLNSVYKQNSNAAYLANFAFFAAKNDNHWWVKKLVLDSFREYIQYNIKYFTDYKQYSIGFIGAVAFQFQEILREALNNEELVAAKILKSPAEALMNYHGSIFRKKL